jgi:hypothetical protein
MMVVKCWTNRDDICVEFLVQSHVQILYCYKDDEHGEGVWWAWRGALGQGNASDLTRCIIASNLTRRASPLLSVTNFRCINTHICKCRTFPGHAGHFVPNARICREPCCQDVTTRSLLIIFNLTFLKEDYQRTEIPDLFVNILAAIFIEANSWNSNFAAYGIWICEILVLFLQGRHSKD